MKLLGIARWSRAWRTTATFSSRPTPGFFRARSIGGVFGTCGGLIDIDRFRLATISRLGFGLGTIMASRGTFRSRLCGRSFGVSHFLRRSRSRGGTLAPWRPGFSLRRRFFAEWTRILLRGSWPSRWSRFSPRRSWSSPRWTRFSFGWSRFSFRWSRSFLRWLRFSFWWSETSSRTSPIPSWAIFSFQTRITHFLLTPILPARITPFHGWFAPWLCSSRRIGFHLGGRILRVRFRVTVGLSN